MNYRDRIDTKHHLIDLKRYSIILYLCILVVLLISPLKAKNVLLLNSYHKGLSWTDGVTESISQSLKNEDIDLYIEYMDAKRMDPSNTSDAVLKFLRSKYASHNFDVIIVSDNIALDFVKENRSFFSETPVVFCGINNFSKNLIKDLEPITGVVEQSSPAGTASLIRQLHPKVNRCIIIADETTTGNAEIIAARRALGNKFAGINIEYWHGLKISELLNRIAILDPFSDAIILTVFNRDSTGRYLSFEQSASIMSSTAECPVYGLWDFYLGSGVVGGKMITASQQGLAASRIVIDILAGRPTRNIPIVREESNKTLFDYTTLKNLGIMINQLPQHSLIFDNGRIVYQSKSSANLRIGVLTCGSKQECIEQWSPTIDHLTLKTPKYFFELIPLDFDEVEPAVIRRDVDFIITNPAQFVELYKVHNLSAIATMTTSYKGQSYTNYGGVIITRNDRSDIASLEDLKDKSFISVNPKSFGGWYTVWRELDDKNINPYEYFSELEFAGGNHAVIENVINGKFDAGAIKTNILEQMDENHEIDINSLKVINPLPASKNFPFVHSTRLYPEWPVVAVNNNAQINNMVSSAFIAIERDNNATKATNHGVWAIPQNYQPVIDCLIQLKVRPYEDYGDITITDTLKRYWKWITATLLFLTTLIIFSVYSLAINQKLRALSNSLSKSEQLMTSTLHSIGDGVISTDAEGKIRDMNPIAEDLTEWSLDEALGYPLEQVFEIVNNKTGKSVKNPARRALKEGIIFNLANHTNLISREGIVRRIADSASPIKDDKGNIIGSVLVFRDITATYEANELSKQREKRFEQISEQSREVVWEVDSNGLFTYLSIACEEVFGYTQDELVGQKHFFDIHPEADRDDFTEKALSIFSEKGTFKDLLNEIETKDGRSIWVSTNGLPILDTNRELLGYRGVDKDMTEMIIARKEIEKKNTFLNGLIDSIPDMIFLKNQKGVYLGCNPEFEKFTGKNRKDIIGKTDYDLFDKEMADFFRENDKKMMDSGKARTNEETVTYPDGTEVPLETTKAPLITANGEVIGIVGIARNITK